MFIKQGIKIVPIFDTFEVGYISVFGNYGFNKVCNGCLL